jgi:hypothetical protein
MPGEPRPLSKAQRELISYLFDSQTSALSAPLSQWVAASARYAAFLDEYKDKIRKKVRVTRDGHALADLLHELQVPYWLLQDRRFDMTYEAYASGKVRGPDFTATFRGNFIFNVEATHVRELPAAGAELDLRLADVLCNKLPQMATGRANVLILAGKLAAAGGVDLGAQVARLKQRAERREEAFYARYAFGSPAEFVKCYERLSAVGFYDSVTGEPLGVWVNSQAKVKLADGLAAVLARGFGGEE